MTRDDVTEPGVSVVRGMKAAYALAWQACPGMLLLQLVTAVIGGMAPVATAWLTKIALDEITAPPLVPGHWCGWRPASVSWASRWLPPRPSRTTRRARPARHRPALTGPAVRRGQPDERAGTPGGAALP
ncbi:hypothetical protein ACFQYP_32890 [Nonomuraea antimicrobica]